jgi:hypothetical protein
VGWHGGGTYSYRCALLLAVRCTIATRVATRSCKEGLQRGVGSAVPSHHRAGSLADRRAAWPHSQHPQPADSSCSKPTAVSRGLVDIWRVDMRQLETTIRKIEDNIETDFREMCCEDVNWIM